MWLSDRYSTQQDHADRQQTCLARLARDVAYALEVGGDTLKLRLGIDSVWWLLSTLRVSVARTMAALEKIEACSELPLFVLFDMLCGFDHLKRLLDWSSLRARNKKIAKHRD